MTFKGKLSGHQLQSEPESIMPSWITFDGSINNHRHSITHSGTWETINALFQEYKDGKEYVTRIGNGEDL